jgi:calcium-dependent protein kinase
MLHHANSIDEVTFSSSQFIQKKNASIYEHYRLGKTIGAGAFGSVFVAHHRRSGLPRAIKAIDKQDFDFAE